ncbi:MAG: amidase family protein, partial [Rugosibacter sp.]|nr:amidase family protein [Rugosibacter sp.]
MINASLKQLSAALAQKQISSVELATLFLNRIEQLNPDINAFITTDREKTLTQARQADDIRQSHAKVGAGDTAPNPLSGIPLAHKDIFCTQGWRTTCGSKMLA